MSKEMSKMVQIIITTCDCGKHCDDNCQFISEYGDVACKRHDHICYRDHENEHCGSGHKRRPECVDEM